MPDADATAPAASAASDEQGDQVELRALLAAAVSAIGGSARVGQQAMAAAVLDAIADRHHLLVQAGTGTGKSLAYLVPALQHAMTGERVVVSTATLALQAQLVDRDLPAVVQACAPLLDRTPSYAIVKGRHNYACLHRVREGAPDAQGVLVEAPGAGAPEVHESDADFPSGTGSELGQAVVALREWAEEQARTDGDGDRAHAPSHTDRAWNQVAVPARECLGAAECPYGEECFAERARDTGRVSDIVVTNHALLAIDAFENGSVLPEHDVVVIDEAHDLAARVTQVASAELAPRIVERVLRRARTYLDDAPEAALETAAEDLRAALDAARPGQLRKANAPAMLLGAVAAVRDATRVAYSGLSRPPGESSGGAAGGVDKAEAGRRQARAALKEVFDTAERMAELSDADVVWVADTQRLGHELRIAPLSVALDVRSRVLGGRTAVLTSATLNTGGDFVVAAGQLGLSAADRLPEAYVASGNDDRDGAHDAPDAERSSDSSSGGRHDEDDGDDDRSARWRGLDVGSPFSYEKQAICYIARHLPPPGRDGPSEKLLAEITALVSAAGGRTLGLFSSRRVAELAAEAVRERTDLAVLCQGDAHLGELSARFTAEPETSLFGSLSLWQGIDVPGATCTLVLIDRIPFPRPDDPLMAARAKAVDDAGGNGFMSVSAAHAGLLLAQGSGRLIRTDTDRGVVALLDSRLATARYAGFLRASLPPMWPTADTDAVVAALKRLAAG